MEALRERLARKGDLKKAPSRDQAAGKRHDGLVDAARA
jgi:hypothetical protein